MEEERRRPVCSNGHGDMTLRKDKKNVNFRGEELIVEVELFVCDFCKLEVGTPKQTGTIQKAIADAYRKKVGLLPGSEIAGKRGKLGLSQQQLADMMKVGVASIKRWEGGLIQSQSMDHLLRDVLEGLCSGDDYSGNRRFSLARIKLVFREFEKVLKRPLLKKNDRMLYAAKYLFYTDMLAHRELGSSLTGATYAALPQGPQLNNYKELVGPIGEADETEAEPLTEEEKRIIRRIAMRFPKSKIIYDVSHRETIWARRTTGATIPYTDSKLLKAI